MQFAVASSPCVTTVLGSDSASHVERDIAWIAEPIDADLLAEVEVILAPVQDLGWVNGRPENPEPARWHELADPGQPCAPDQPQGA